MALARHCDATECDTWERLDSGLPDVRWMELHLAEVLHFCSRECLTAWVIEDSLQRNL